jgi:class 3 adenylate cyclase
MTTLRTTVILKTDIRSSTVRFRMLPEADLDALLAEHARFVARLAQVHDGRVVKSEGDGFWLVFPSATAAALAAMSMQEELRLAQPNKGDDRLAMRIVITVGDVLHQEGGLIGDAVVLATRIEAITPPDEIYVSAPAWLAMNQAGLSGSLVDAFVLKGFPDPISVYRIEQRHRMRVIRDQYIVFTDLRDFNVVTEESSLTVVEKILDRHLDLVGQVCAEFSGTHRSQTGDSYIITFPDAARAMGGVSRLAEGWCAFQREEAIDCSMNIVVHRGALYVFRSYLLSPGINVAAHVERATSRLGLKGASIFLTSDVRKDLANTTWETELQRVDVQSSSRALAGVEIYRLER